MVSIETTSGQRNKGSGHLMADDDQYQLAERKTMLVAGTKDKVNDLLGKNVDKRQSA